jgi:transposase-like protein
MSKTFINRFKGKGVVCCATPKWHSHGRFRRKSDARLIQRFKCYSCEKTMSNATFDPACWQKKRHLNHSCMMLLSSLVSMRRIGLILNINPKTVARKLTFLGETLQKKMAEESLEHITEIQCDELQTIEHTKLKPLSIAVAVSSKDRRIVGFRVASMPATGHLATASRKKYGPRPDHRPQQFESLCQEIQQRCPRLTTIMSDECSFYGPIFSKVLPAARAQQYKGEKSSVAGQGELKKVARDPLFWVNHTLAMLRANINRLIRKTWCTTKKIQPLIHHVTVTMFVHNHVLVKRAL